MCRKKNNQKQISDADHFENEGDTLDEYITFLDAASDGNAQELKRIYNSVDRVLRSKLLLFQDGDENTALHFGARSGNT